MSVGVNNLPKVVTRQHGGRGSNSRPLSHQSDTLATRLSSHPIFVEVTKYLHNSSTSTVYGMLIVQLLDNGPDSR